MKTNQNQNDPFSGWKRQIKDLIKEHPLQIISWEATRRCNLKCVHCGSPAESVRLEDELSTDEVVGAFEQIMHDFDMTRFRHINITGGEPFVRKDLLKVLKRISRFPAYRNIDIQTNGIAIAEHPDLLAELKAYGVTGLGISIDGLEETHDAFRKFKGGYAKAFCAAQLAVQHGYVVTVSVVAHAKNIEEIPSLFQVVKNQIKPRVFRLMTMDQIGRAESLEEYKLSTMQFSQVIKFLQNEYAKSCTGYGDPQSTMVEIGCGGWLGEELEGLVRPFIFHCIAGINNLGILFDGKLGACSNIPRNFIEGDLRKDRIKDVWENGYQRHRQPDWKKVGVCKECSEWEYCHGGPMHLRTSGSSSCQDCAFMILRNYLKTPSDRVSGFADIIYEPTAH